MQTPDRQTTDRDVAAIEDVGYVVIEGLLDAATVDEARSALTPWLDGSLLGRNDFEGHATERVYSLVARGKVFEDIVEHPRILAILDRFLEANYLLTASQAIQIRPGETAQGLHTDDAFYRIPRPRRAFSLATIWAIDAFTEENGATEIAPGSHRWDDGEVERLLERIDFSTRKGASPRAATSEPEALSSQLVQGVMSAGSVIVFLGTLVHRGGPNQSASPRLALSNQYCEPWARQQENYFLSIPRDRVASMSERVQQLIGYSVHPPFMGHANAVHPRRFLQSKRYEV